MALSPPDLCLRRWPRGAGCSPGLQAPIPIPLCLPPARTQRQHLRLRVCTAPSAGLWVWTDLTKVCGWGQGAVTAHSLTLTMGLLSPLAIPASGISCWPPLPDPRCIRSPLSTQSPSQPLLSSPPPASRLGLPLPRTSRFPSISYPELSSLPPASSRALPAQALPTECAQQTEPPSPQRACCPWETIFRPIPPGCRPVPRALLCCITPVAVPMLPSPSLRCGTFFKAFAPIRSNSVCSLL